MHILCLLNESVALKKVVEKNRTDAVFYIELSAFVWYVNLCIFVAHPLFCRVWRPTVRPLLYQLYSFPPRPWGLFGGWWLKVVLSFGTHTFVFSFCLILVLFLCIRRNSYVSQYWKCGLVCMTVLFVHTCPSSWFSLKPLQLTGPPELLLICLIHRHVTRSHRRRLPRATVNSLERDWLRSWVPPEYMELWATRFKIKEGRHWLSDSLPWGCLTVLLQLPAFPKARYVGWEGTPGAA